MSIFVYIHLKGILHSFISLDFAVGYKYHLFCNIVFFFYKNLNNLFMSFVVDKWPKTQASFARNVTPNIKVYNEIVG